MVKHPFYWKQFAFIGPSNSNDETPSWQTGLACSCSDACHAM
jgi:hypothetical protein